MKSARLVVIDNYDSFTHNLVQMFSLYDLSIAVYRADTIDVGALSALAPDYCVISPGPKNPAAAGISVEVVGAFAGRIPILGVCLGMQCINEAFGGTTLRAPVPMHGKTSRVFHDKTGIFNGVADPFTAARYHSLVADPRDTELVVNAVSEDGDIMGLAAAKLDVYGVQFHPESFLTEGGFRLVENFLKTGPLAEKLENGLVIAEEAMAFTRYRPPKNQAPNQNRPEWI
ncbi:MAG: anthranilate synthase component II [Thermodesulfobacteriota bacterium]